MGWAASGPQGRKQAERGSHRPETRRPGAPGLRRAPFLQPHLSECWQSGDPHSASVRFGGWLSLLLQMYTRIYRNGSCSLLPMRDLRTVDGTALSSTGPHAGPWRTVISFSPGGCSPSSGLGILSNSASDHSSPAEGALTPL